MSIHELLKDALKTALTNAEKLDQTGTKWVSFGGKALVKNFPELGLFSDEPFFMLLADLCKTEVWAIEVNKNSIVEVEGLANLKLKIDLAFFEDIAVYCDYIRLEDQLDQKWQTYNLEHRLLYSGFRWKKWGDTQARAAANIKQARKMLVSGVFSLRQLSAILVYDDKQLQEQDLEQLLSLYPECETNVRVRRVILNFHCNQMPSCCLIVENMDTYHYLRPLVPNDWMLVCGFGQRITKKNVRDEAVVDLHASAETPVHFQQACRDFWLTGKETFLYWGDLDKNGEQIFQTLKQQFTGLEQWQPAYYDMRRIAREHGLTAVYQEAVLKEALF